MSVNTVRLMMNLKIYVENLCQRPIIICVLIDLKREIREDILYIMKAKPRIENAGLKRSLFRT